MWTSGAHKGGKNVRNEGNSTANMLVAVLRTFGLENSSIGDSTGTWGCRRDGRKLPAAGARSYGSCRE